MLPQRRRLQRPLHPECGSDGLACWRSLAGRCDHRVLVCELQAHQSHVCQFSKSCCRGFGAVSSCQQLINFALHSECQHAKRDMGGDFGIGPVAHRPKFKHALDFFEVAFDLILAAVQLNQFGRGLVDVVATRR